MLRLERPNLRYVLKLVLHYGDYRISMNANSAVKGGLLIQAIPERRKIMMLKNDDKDKNDDSSEYSECFLF